MTESNASLIDEGERRFKSRQKLVYGLLAGGLVLGFFAGLLSGIVQESVEDGSLPGWTLVAILALFMCALVWLMYAYFKNTDELEWMNNLWSAQFAICFYIFALPTWYILNSAGVVPPVDHWLVWKATGFILVAVYGIRKFIWR